MQQVALQRRQTGDVLGLPPPPRLGTPAQRAEPGARRVDEHPVAGSPGARPAPARRPRPPPRCPPPPGAPGRPGAARPRRRAVLPRARRRSPRAAPPCRPGRRTGRASAGRLRPAAHRPARARPAGCPRPAPRPGPRARRRARRGRRRAARRRTATTGPRRHPPRPARPRWPGPGGRPASPAAARCPRPAGPRSRSSEPPRASRNAETTQRGCECTTARLPTGSVSYGGATAVSQASRS